MVWVISVREPYVSAILAGKKTMEVRTRIAGLVRRGDTLLIIQVGTGGKVRVKCKIESIVRMPPRRLYAIYKDAIQVGEPEYNEYFKGYIDACGMKLTEVEELPEGTCREDFGLTHSPQWFALAACDRKGLL